MGGIPPEIFKAYDIRGIVGKTLTPEFVELIGRAVASEARARGCGEVVIGRDGRLSGPALIAALATGLRRGGVEVIDIGQVTTPMAYFAAHHLDTRCAVMLTGSHNPPDYNGLKIVIAGITLSGEAIQDLRRRIETGDLSHGEGGYRQYDIAAEYIARIVGDVKLARPMKVVLDAGNGVAGAYAPALFRALGCEVEALFCEVDGHFPNHHPDPSVPENLADLIDRVKRGEAEIGLAFDGDGDRLGVVAKNGAIIYPDRQLMLFAADVLSRNPGALVIYDVKSTRNLRPWIAAHGGRSLIWKTGHSLMKAKMRETGALLAGELSGHSFFQDRWYGFDDGLYAGARLLEYLSNQPDPEATLRGLPDSVNTPELHVRMREGEPHRIIEQLREHAHFDGAREVITLDGLRVEYDDGFGLIRASNTTPVIMLRFEADNPAALKRIQAQFRRLLSVALPAAQLPF
ncbi:MAG: phosphomannomutase/phosphoglucomutase [Pseudomonadota bacterium]|nr:phosphomannomutase/phosphoglucomutase [Pseudomonadota bacterium]MDP1905009.1 phosphomannomutase/phosphoglucomutase [Pseudomonadota bacterium]MDP2353194.1 phosphomannomutase/phosphoglucomutase [Pseudomonadota bacterium]